VLSDHPVGVARGALFQPWIHLPGEGWLKLGLLLRDRIDRIVPDSSDVPDLAPTPQLEILASRGLIGDQIVTYADAEQVRKSVLDDIDAAQGSGLFYRWVEAGRPFSRDPEYTRIHTAKISRDFARQLERRGISSHERGSFLYSEPAVVGLYMFKLAQLLHSRVVDSCLVSDSRGYAGLETLVGESAGPEAGEQTFISLLLGVSIDPAGVTSMSAEDFTDWHREKSSLRKALREKLSDITSDPAFTRNRLQAAMEDFNHYVADLPRRTDRLVNDSLAVLGLAIPVVGVALDISTHTSGLGELVTVPLGAMVSGAAFVRQRRASGWERYLVEIQKHSTQTSMGNVSAIENVLKGFGRGSGR
jgi:hypothetical protein